MNDYSQVRAMLAITTASLRSIFRSPQSVFFSLFFPIVLIVIFGALSNNGGMTIDIAIAKNTDTANAVYPAIKHSPVLRIREGGQDTLEDLMKKGKITALLEIRKNNSNPASPVYDIHLRSSSANQRELPALQSVLGDIIGSIDKKVNPVPSMAQITVEEVEGREYKLIDFYLPGMIGFSLIGSAVFGVSFLFFNLRETLVLKRLYASPIRKRYIILGETLSRIIFQLFTVIVLIGFGRFFYGFTLANGFLTFLEMLFVSTLGLVVFMGAGFVISGFAKNQNVIPIYSNLFMFPQYFLSGTFFPKSALPSSIQWLVEALPLTALNDALRKISFEGAGLLNCAKEVGILAAWGIVVYAIAIKVFKWES